MENTVTRRGTRWVPAAVILLGFVVAVLAVAIAVRRKNAPLPACDEGDDFVRAHGNGACVRKGSSCAPTALAADPNAVYRYANTGMCEREGCKDGYTLWQGACVAYDTSCDDTCMSRYGDSYLRCSVQPSEGNRNVGVCKKVACQTGYAKDTTPGVGDGKCKQLNEPCFHFERDNVVSVFQSTRDDEGQCVPVRCKDDHFQDPTMTSRPVCYRKNTLKPCDDMQKRRWAEGKKELLNKSTLCYAHRWVYDKKGPGEWKTGKCEHMRNCHRFCRFDRRVNRCEKSYGVPAPRGEFGKGYPLPQTEATWA